MFNRYTTAMIDVHEAYPGHFLQFLYMPAVKSKVRKLMYTTANVEGWAHYAEQMMIDEGFGGGFGGGADGPSEAAPRAAPGGAAARLPLRRRHQDAHAGHDASTRRRASSSSRASRSRPTPTRRRCAARYDPMYLAYTLGKLQIQALRDEYLARTGRDLRAFHDAFVAQGGLPVAFIRKLILPAETPRRSWCTRPARFRTCRPPRAGKLGPMSFMPALEPHEVGVSVLHTRIGARRGGVHEQPARAPRNRRRRHRDDGHRGQRQRRQRDDDR